MRDWPFTENGELRVSKRIFAIISDLRSQRAEGNSLKAISRWLKAAHEIAMTPGALHRLLTAGWPPIVVDDEPR